MLRPMVKMIPSHVRLLAGAVLMLATAIGFTQSAAPSQHPTIPSWSSVGSMPL
jgi:hypothetical protein